MKKIILFVSLFITLGTQAQKTVHDNNAVSRSARGFHAIEISDGIDLYLTQGNEETVAVSASGNEYRNKIQVEVVNGILKIYYDRGNWGININWGNRKLKAYVSVKHIDRLSASGGADVYVENELNASSLKMDFSGGSDFRGRVSSSDLQLSASGGSDAYISGRADKLKLHASGGSDIHGYELVTNFCDLETSGGSDVKITANKEISGNTSGGSDVYYKGSASSSVSKSGGASIKKIG